MTFRSESRVCGMYEKTRVELGYALMTLKSKSNVCGMHRKSRMVV